MSTDVKEFREDKNLNRAASPSPALLTRADAAALLHCSISSIRRLEGDVLHPIVGSDGVHRFDPAEIARVAGHRSARPVDGSKEGERDARVFEELEEGKGLREIVTTLRLPADLVSKLHASWLKMGSNQDMILSSERLALLRAALRIDVKRPGDLVDEVRWLAEQCNTLEADRNSRPGSLDPVRFLPRELELLSSSQAGAIHQKRSSPWTSYVLLSKPVDKSTMVVMLAARRSKVNPN
jgi:hypothetical protein